MQFSRLLSFVFTSVLVGTSLGATYERPSDLPTLTYDYVIIGAGNAGLVLANRLTETAGVTVLVLEAGVSDDGVIAAQAPFLAPTLTPNTAYDWNYTVSAQSALNGRTFPYPRGYLLGGSSSANYLFHQYGTAGDWDKIASITGDTSFRWTNVKKYVKKHESLKPPVDGHNTAGQINPAVHGTTGPTSISLPGLSQAIDNRVINTTQQLAEFPYIQDTSGGDQNLLGVGWIQSSSAGGLRSSSSTSYLAQANTRSTLSVLIHATVSKLIKTGTKGSAQSFRKVEFKSSPGTGSTPAGTTTVVTARREVILSAGAVGTAQILQLSGIGKQSDLQALGITTLVNNPNVGANLMDHAFLPNNFKVVPGVSYDDILRDASRIGAAVGEWISQKTGMLANSIANNYGFKRLPSSSSIFSTVPDPATASSSPHWEIIFSNFWINPTIAMPATGSFFTIVTCLLSPTSRGTVKITSTNPFTSPAIDPKFLSTPFDVFTMRESVKAAKRFVGAPAWADYVTGAYGDLATANTDAQIDAYVRKLTTTVFHPMGTASLTKKTSSAGVVNPDFTVKGTDGLRIVDASVFPIPISAHPQGAVYLLAEKASDVIKAC